MELEVFDASLKVGSVTIHLSVQHNYGFTLMFTINDGNERRILKGPVMENGKIKVFASAEAAIEDALSRLASATHKEVEADPLDDIQKM